MRNHLAYALVATFMAAAVLLAVSPAPAQSPFTDVPEDYWAYPWILSAYEQGLVRGYWDGTYHPEYNVTRDQMAVFIVRLLERVRGQAGFGLVQLEEPGVIKVVASGTNDAQEYRLYSSTDGVNFTLVTNATFWTAASMVFWEVPGVTSERLFKPVAVVGDSERQLCGLLSARPNEPITPLTITSPTGSAISRVPVIAWQPVDGAVAYVVIVEPSATGDGETFVAAVEGWRTGIRYNQVAGPGIVAAFCDNPFNPQPLEANTDYTVLVGAVDASGWLFAVGQQEVHTSP